MVSILILKYDEDMNLESSMAVDCNLAGLP